MSRENKSKIGTDKNTFQRRPRANRIDLSGSQEKGKGEVNLSLGVRRFGESFERKEDREKGGKIYTLDRRVKGFYRSAHSAEPWVDWVGLGWNWLDCVGLGWNWSLCIGCVGVLMRWCWCLC